MGKLILVSESIEFSEIDDEHDLCITSYTDSGFLTHHFIDKTQAQLIINHLKEQFEL